MDGSIFGFSEEDIKLYEIFHPYMFKKVMVAHRKNMRFVHYTRAESALSMLRNREVWMRKSSCMNDFMEVEHGLNCLVATYNGAVGKKFQSNLEELFPGFCKEFQDLFNAWIPHFKQNTYLTSISEHADTEDRYGRLSMWRAYGSGTGVCIVLNNRVLLEPSDALKAYTSPVAYLGDEESTKEFKFVSKNIKRNAELLFGVGRSTVLNWIFQMFKFAALCTKHPGFKEELEWRIVYSPTIENSEKLEKATVVLGGIPQQIYKIPLRNFPDEGFFGAEPSELVNRIIIGPTDYAPAMREAFIEALSNAGVESPAACVVISDIPLR